MSLLRVAPGLIVMACLGAGASMPADSNVPPPSPDLLGVKSVYILPMRSGFDQYLANELTSRGVVRVVTDPHRADAVLTDHLGQSFQQRMDDLFPQAAKPKAKDAAKESDSTEGGAQNAAADSAEESIPDSRPITSGISGGKGNVFLVGREGRAVLWSDFRNPRSRQPKDMKHTADSVASDLKRALQPPDSGSK
jgi:hypothetical protein